MTSEPLTAADVDLFEQARALLERAHHPELHQVAVALRGTSGRVYLGLHLGSRRINICAESSAIANAVMAGEDGVAAIVAVCRDHDGRTVVTNPCGVCRELLGQYGPHARVLLDIHGQVRTRPTSELMPNPWMFPHENDWVVEEPGHGGAS